MRTDKCILDDGIDSLRRDGLRTDLRCPACWWTDGSHLHRIVIRPVDVRIPARLTLSVGEAHPREVASVVNYTIAVTGLECEWCGCVLWMIESQVARRHIPVILACIGGGEDPCGSFLKERVKEACLAGQITFAV